MSLCQSMGKLITASGYKNSFIADKIGMQPSNFSSKKSRASWTPEEIDKILSVIDNEDLDDYFMVQLMEQDRKANEPTISADEFKRRMGWS